MLGDVINTDSTGKTQTKVSWVTECFATAWHASHVKTLSWPPQQLQSKRTWPNLSLSVCWHVSSLTVTGLLILIVIYYITVYYYILYRLWSFSIQVIASLTSMQVHHSSQQWLFASLWLLTPVQASSSNCLSCTYSSVSFGQSDRNRQKQILWALRPVC